MPDEAPLSNRIANAAYPQSRKPCPFCGNDTWTSIPPSHLLGNYHPEPPDSDTPEGVRVIDHEVRFPGFAFVCTECGFIRLHAVMTSYRSP